MNNKGTISLEIIVTFMIFIIISTMMITFSLNEFNQIDQTQNRKEARLITTHLSQLIDNTYINGQGYSQTYTLPEKINDESYILFINESGIYLNSHNQITRDTYMKNTISFNNGKKIILTPGNTYQFTNNNDKVDIYQHN